MEEQARVTLESEQVQPSVPPVANTPFTLPAIIWFFALLAISYADVFRKLVNQWIIDEDMGHGFFVPVIAGYIAYQRREQLYRIAVKNNPLGLVLIVVG